MSCRTVPALAHDSTLESAGVSDGTVLRLVRVEDAPSAPIIHDVSDEVADDLDVRAWRWRPAVRRVVAGCATVLFALAAAVLARGEFTDSGAGVLVAAALCAVAGVLSARVRRQVPGVTLLVTAGALASFGVWACADAYGWSGAARLAGVVGVVVVVLLLAGLVTPFGRGALVGGGAVAGCLVLWKPCSPYRTIKHGPARSRPSSASSSSVCCHGWR